ncbi:MAG: discoidin domain-containing protein [Candidatus Zhuqueibacterota bacterium]
MWKKNWKTGITSLIFFLLFLPQFVFSQVWTETSIDSFKTGQGIDSLNVAFITGDTDDGSIILAPASENFAARKKAWDSDDKANNNANLVLDGSRKSPSFWASYTPFCVGISITIDLEATRTVERVNILGSDFNPQMLYIKGYSIYTSLDDNNYSRVAQNLSNKQWDVYEEFAPVTARYIRITIEATDNQNWTIIGEIEVYGSGYASSGHYISRIKDFGNNVNFGKAIWQATIPSETKLTVQFRSDSTHITGETYIAEDTVKLSHRPVMTATERVTNSDGSVVFARNMDYIIDYESGKILRTVQGTIIPGQELRISYKTWSAWSPASEASTGELFKTLEPRRYLQYRLNFQTFSLETPAFQQMSIEYSENAVMNRAVATVSPTEVPVLRESRITYRIELTSFGGDLGIDTLKIETPASARLRDIRLDGVALNYRDLTDPLVSEIVAYFPNRIASLQSGLLEVDFSITLFESENFFPATLVSTQTPGNPQFVEQGMDGWRVVTTGIPESPLVSVTADPNPMSPNGDNICDATEISFFVAKIADSRRVMIKIFNLNGDCLRTLHDAYSMAKDFRVKWDGKDGWGNLVQPGVYLYQVSVNTDADDYVITKTITVVY